MTATLMMPPSYVDVSKEEMEYDGGRDIWLDRYTKFNTTTNTTTQYLGAKLYDDYSQDLLMLSTALGFVCPPLGLFTGVALGFASGMNNYYMNQ